MRVHSWIGNLNSLAVILRISLFVAAASILLLHSAIGQHNNHKSTSFSHHSSETNYQAYCYNLGPPNHFNIDTNCTLLSNTSVTSARSHFDAAQLAKEQAATAEHEKRQDAARGLIIKHQQRKMRQLNTKEKVQKVGILVGVIVVGANGWWIVGALKAFVV